MHAPQIILLLWLAGMIADEMSAHGKIVVATYNGWLRTFHIIGIAFLCWAGGFFDR